MSENRKNKTEYDEYVVDKLDHIDENLNWIIVILLGIVLTQLGVVLYFLFRMFPNIFR